MKRITAAFSLSLFILMSSFTPPTGEQIKWLDFKQGYSLAKKKNKIMLVDVYTDWCGWCKRMDRDTYERSDIAEHVNKDFVAIKINPEIGGVMYEFNGRQYSGAELAAVIGNNGIGGYPATVFIYPKSEKRMLVVGYKNGEAMKDILAEMKNTYYAKK
jgi:uncharacterized protein YyaL (SSP411 family)